MMDSDTSFQIPAELLHLILSEYRPVYNAETIEVVPTRNTKVPTNWVPYACQLQFFAQLRLVCRSWYNFITPLLYSTFTLPTHPYDDLERVARGLSHYPKLIDHLVLRGHTGGAEEQHAAELLSACLSQCTNIHTLEILDAHRIFRSSSKSKCLAIFRALPSTAPLTSLVFRFPHYSTQFTYPISTTLLGLGQLIRNLKTLEIHQFSTAWRPHDAAPLVLPSAFPNLNRLVVHTSSGGLSPNDLSKIISRISSRDTPAAVITSNAPSDSAKRKRNMPLRDLTLSWNRTSRSAMHICNILKTNDLGKQLTALWIDSDHFHFSEEDSLPTLPGIIIAACPHLETFIYYVKSPDTIFTLLPRTLRVLGISLPEDMEYHMDKWVHVKPLTNGNYEPLVDWLAATNGNGIRKLLIQRVQLLPAIRERVKAACQAANVGFAFD
ncbi:hypothetical protein BDN72DRAFT_961053 [Pluteus cervinus]|uniref:Uncharacterized protein n=1 Tax=Pluteus cervinus TaxID=181527 RepID=A0ACD3ANZ2_9AGAR|nr:hypothetical protein BDN72DRAFT_961053 [Pluteus cervinus]